MTYLVVKAQTNVPPFLPERYTTITRIAIRAKKMTIVFRLRFIFALRTHLETGTTNASLVHVHVTLSQTIFIAIRRSHPSNRLWPSLVPRPPVFFCSSVCGQYNTLKRKYGTQFVTKTPSLQDSV